MTQQDPMGPVVLRVGRDIEERHARMAKQEAYQAQPRKPEAPGVLGAIKGMLSNVESKIGRNDAPYMRATLTYTVDGIEKTVTALLSARVMERGTVTFVDGPAHLFGDLRATTFSVIGPAYTKKADRANNTKSTAGTPARKRFYPRKAAPAAVAA